MTDLLAPLAAPRRLVWALLFVLCPAGAHAQADSSAVRAGYLAHTVEGGSETLYFFHVAHDGALSLRQGTDPSAPSVTVPAVVARTALEQVNAVAPRDAAHTERLDVDLQGKMLWVRWAKRMNVFWILAAGGVLGGTVMGAGVWLWLRRERAERRRLAESRAHLAAGQEAERNRLAHELHDGPLQDLHGIRMRFGALRPSLRPAWDPGSGVAEAESNTHETEALEEDLVTVISELRAIMADLHPPALTPFGLGAALRAHLTRFERRYPHLGCRLEAEGTQPTLAHDVRLVLFRVCQEALSNAAKHAQARRVEVRFGVENNRVVLRVSDDGQGFTETDRRGSPERGSFGLSNMAARAEAVGADLRITSAPGRGTTIEVAAPLAEAEPPEPRSPKRKARPRGALGPATPAGAAPASDSWIRTA